MHRPTFLRPVAALPRPLLAGLLLPVFAAAQGRLLGPGGPPAPQTTIPSVDWRKELAPLVGGFRATGERRRVGFDAQRWSAVCRAEWVLRDRLLRQELVVTLDDGATHRWITWFGDDPGGAGACAVVFGDNGSVAGPVRILRGDPNAAQLPEPGGRRRPPAPDLRCAFSMQPVAAEISQLARLGWRLREDGYELEFVRTRMDGLVRFEGRGRFVPDAEVDVAPGDGRSAAQPAAVMRRLAGWEGSYEITGGYVPPGLGFANRDGGATARALLSGHVLQVDETFQDDGPVLVTRVLAWDAAEDLLRFVTFQANGSVQDLRLRPDGPDRWLALHGSGNQAGSTILAGSEDALSEIRTMSMSSLDGGVHTDISSFRRRERAPR